MDVTKRNNLRIRVRKLVMDAVSEACKEYETPEGTAFPYWTEFDALKYEPGIVDKLITDLINTMLGINAGNLIMIPTIEESREYVRRLIPGEEADNEDFVEPHAERLIEFLREGYYSYRNQIITETGKEGVNDQI